MTTGAYGDGNAQDEFIWAAAELYLSTGDESYYNSVDMIPVHQISLPSWGPLGYYSLLRFSDQLTGAAKEDLPQIRRQVVNFADKLAEGGHQSAYRVVMGHLPKILYGAAMPWPANRALR